jgi:tRNA A-37 threonylcarbamoyl transferase component Bud32
MAQVLDIFANRYAIERELARGGMADVYLATDRELKRKVAVKVLFPEFARDPSFVERFRREARNAASLNHPNIAAVYDWGQERGSYYIVMEYVEGRSLRDVIHNEGPIPPLAAARIATELADALAFAHRRGVIHRDVKPGNVLLTPTGQVKLTDFGIAANETDANQGLTQTGSVMGTATYFSPEQAQGHAVDSRSDVYALGVVLYEMLCGAPPFSGESPVAIAMKHVRETPPPMTDRAPDVPAQLQSIVNAALTKDIDARYQSAEELRVDLIDYARGRPLTFAYEPGATDATIAAQAPTVAAAVARSVIPAPTPRRRNWAGAVAAIIGLSLLAAVVAYLLTSTRESTTPTARVEIPNVVGQQFDTASAALTGSGFSVSRLDDELSTQPPGTVLAQDPVGGRLADKGTTVRGRPASAAHAGGAARERRFDPAGGDGAGVEPAGEDQGCQGFDGDPQRGGRAGRRRPRRRPPAPGRRGLHPPGRGFEPGDQRRGERDRSQGIGDSHRAHRRQSDREELIDPAHRLEWPARGRRAQRRRADAGRGNHRPAQQRLQRRRATGERPSQGHRLQPDAQERHAAQGQHGHDLRRRLTRRRR